MELKDYLQNRSELVEQALESWLPGDETLPGSLHKAMRYSVFAGGTPSTDLDDCCLRGRWG